MKLNAMKNKKSLNAIKRQQPAKHFIMRKYIYRKIVKCVCGMYGCVCVCYKFCDMLLSKIPYKKLIL